jgi:hypothetical protein
MIESQMRTTLLIAPKMPEREGYRQDAYSTLSTYSDVKSLLRILFVMATTALFDCGIQAANFAIYSVFDLLFG